MHRSDGSGTTFIFTDYLSTVSEEWKTKVGKATSVQWPVGLGGKGNEGVSGTVTQNDGSIGYVELAYAVQNKLAIASMVNAREPPSCPRSKRRRAPWPTSAATCPTRWRARSSMPRAQASWPIAGYTYLLVYMDQTDCTKAQKLVEFINWALTDGTKFATELYYVAAARRRARPGPGQARPDHLQGQAAALEPSADAVLS